MSRPLDCDVAIVGAGPAGCATALFLAHAHPFLARRTVVLEKARFPRDKFCAGAIGKRADDRLASIGIRIDVPSVPVHGVSVTFRHGSLSHREREIGRVVRRLEFDHALAAAVRARGIRVLEGTPVRELQELDDRIILRTGTRAGSDTDPESPRELHARAVVGADGVGSIVRRHLGLPFGALRAAVIEVDTEPLPGDPPPDLIHVDGADTRYSGYAWDFPTIVAGRRLVCRGVYALGIDAEAADPTELLRGRLAARGLDLARYRQKRFLERGFEPQHAIASRRIMLAGEAAGIDPWSGEGIPQAIDYGALAGNYLAEKLSRPELDLSDWSRHVRRSKLGLDLAMRATFVNLVYGTGRDYFDEYYAKNPEGLEILSAFFAGRTPRVQSAARALIGGTVHAGRRLARAIFP